MLPDDPHSNGRSDPSHQLPAGEPAALNPRDKDEYAKDNLIRIPSIQLPKGGGALRSIDEKFSVNSANGTATCNFPIPLSRTRSDFAPSLSLEYNSGGGNSPFGMGWNISLTSIRRRTDKLLPAYEDADNGDIFQLTGLEDLIPKLIQNTNGDWAPDQFTTGHYSIKRFRPRIDGAFTLIEQVVSPAGMYWKTTTKDNIVTFFGLSPAGRLADPRDPTHIFEWWPEISFDDKGNCFQCFYVPEDLQNVPHLLHEANRLNGNQPFSNLYLKRIAYGNTAMYSPVPSGGPPDPYLPVIPDGKGYNFYLVLDYGDHDAGNPGLTPSGSWGCRLDPFSNLKPGFDWRTWRLCRRFLLFHQFAELDADPVMVRSVDLTYQYYDFTPVADPYTLQLAETDLITSLTITGWSGTSSKGYQRSSYPPVVFTYQMPVWNSDVRSISPSNRENIPQGLIPPYQFTDLYNEGIAGILSEQSEGWYYNSNLGDGVFTPASLVAPKPSFTGLKSSSLQLQSLTGDGRKFIVSGTPPNLGFFELTSDGQWLPFMAFEQYPCLDTRDPNVKFIDLNGDGMAEIVLSEEQVFTWYPSAGIVGYDSPELAPKPFDEERGPAIVFSDPVQSIFLADMNGDGLVDIVRIRNGEISYWPNQGYGIFGAKINMTNAPLFDTIDAFNPAYLQLSDINGTGCTDLLYLGQDKLRAWLNLSGNAWGHPFEAPAFPHTASPNQLSVADLLGNGTACIVWSSPLAPCADAPLQYIDLMGGRKPYLMSAYSNGMGKQVTLGYRSSTWFYLQDKLSGTPWITQLCFPVQCVASVLVTDSVSGTRYSSGYTYHHGYYDHSEKEYRGFGRVDQTDTDSFDTNAAADQVPMLTRTWYHTGFYYDADAIFHQFASEYFQNPMFAEYTLPEPALPAGLSPDEAREAARACKGMILRQEIYALDGSVNPILANYPYSAAEHTNTIVLLQPQASNLYAAFISVESENISYHYERNPADPRIAHSLNTAFDRYGNIIDAYAVAYPRQPTNPADPGGLELPGNQPLPASVIAEQAKTYIIYTHHGYTTQIVTAATYRLPVACESIAWQWTGAGPSAGYYSITDFTHPSSPPSLVKLKHQRTLSLRDDLVTPMPLYSMDTLGLVYQHYHLAFDADVTALAGKTTPAILQSAAYIASDSYKSLLYFPSTDAGGEWWVPSGTVQYLNKGVAQPFFQPYQYLDSYGYATTLGFDKYWLVLETVTDAIGNTNTIAAFDYRLLQPATALDANNNATDFRYNILGHAVGIALRGKGEGDVFDAGFATELTPSQIQGFFSDPFSNGPPLLQGATMRYVYVFPSPSDPLLPFSAGVVSREFHAGQYIDSRVNVPAIPYQFSFEYTDGFGRTAMKKIQADLDTGTPTAGSCDGGAPPSHSWIGNGKTVYNNKGKAVMEYEPFFSATPAYEEAPLNGVTPVLHYDPPGRVIRMDFPDGSFSTTAFDPWVQIAYDRNDTVKDSAWYQQHIVSPDPKTVDAATKAAAHYNTPAANHLDPLGRNFFTVSFNIISGVSLFYQVQTVLDLESNPLQVIDAMGNSVIRSDYDLLNRVIHHFSMDAGERWVFPDAMNKPFLGWDHNGSDDLVHSYTYDKLHRMLQTGLQVNGTPHVSTINSYGEGVVIQGVTDVDNNLRGRPYRQFDSSGLLTHYRYDFKGNLVQSSRIFAKAFAVADPNTPPVPWTGGVGDMALLENEEFMTLSNYDALNRPVFQTRPFSTVTPGGLIDPPYTAAAIDNADARTLVYGESGSLLTVNLYYNGGTSATAYVRNIRHNEKGQRLCIQYGNNTVTRYTYDPVTFRLLRLLTTANSGTKILQDLNYYFDPLGNITYSIDKAQPAITYNNQQTLSDADYTYDPLYHLIRATGREQIAQNTVGESASNTGYRNFPYDGVTPLPAPTDTLAMRPYTQLYSYDPAGNMTKLQHVAGTGSYTRIFAYNNNTADRTVFGVSPSAVMNNQLLATTLGGSPAVKYAYDQHGNTTGLVQLASIAWNSKDQLVSSTQQVVSSGSGQTTWYTYDESGVRTRKITLRSGSGGAPPSVQFERLYIGNYEIYRSYDPTGKLILERETLHVIDDKNRVATIDKKTIDTGATDPATLNAYYPRYQYGNHLGSASYELDGAATVITYEEYHPFGTTSFQAADAALDVPAKRYRYIGKERDEETGLGYHGARYYAPWLARWLSSDPIGLAGGLNLYIYCSGNPIMHRDEDGMQDADPPCHTSCHSSPQKFNFDKSLFNLPPLTAEDAEKWYVPPEKRKEMEEQKKAQEDAALTDTLTQIQKADEKSGTGTVCQTYCHGLRGLKNVHGDPKQMNEDAALFVKVVGYELMFVGGAEGYATSGLLRGVLLPAAESAAADYGTTHVLMASGVDKDKAEMAGFFASILLPGALSFKGGAKLTPKAEPDPVSLFDPETLVPQAQKIRTDILAASKGTTAYVPHNLQVAVATGVVDGELRSVATVSNMNAHLFLEKGLVPLPSGIELGPAPEFYKVFGKKQLAWHVEITSVGTLEGWGARGGFVGTSGLSCEMCAQKWFDGKFPTWLHMNWADYGGH